MVECLWINSKLKSRAVNFKCQPLSLHQISTAIIVFYTPQLQDTEDLIIQNYK